MLHVLSYDSALCSQREDLEGFWNEHSTIQKVIGEFSGSRTLSLANEGRNSVKTLLSHAKSGLRTIHVIKSREKELHKFLNKNRIGHEIETAKNLPKDSCANNPRYCWIVSFISPLVIPPTTGSGNKDRSLLIIARGSFEIFCFDRIIYHTIVLLVYTSVYFFLCVCVVY